MKNYLLKIVVIFLLASCVCCTNANAQGIEFFTGTFTEAIAEAEKTNKHVFVDAYTTWCGPCINMAKNVFTQESVGFFYNQQFVNVKLDMEKGEGIAFAQKYGVNRFPSYLYFDGKGELIHRSMGSKKAQPFIADGSNAINDETSLAGMQARFNEGECTNEFLKNYAYTLMYAGENGQIIADQYINTIKEEEITTDENLKFITTFADDINSSAFKHLIKNKDAAIKVLGAQRIEATIERAAYSAIIEPAKNKDKAALRQVQNDLIDMDKVNGSKLATAVGIEFFKATGNYSEYAKEVSEYLGKYEVKEPSTLNNYAWSFYENIDNKKLLKQAVGWTEQSIAMEDKYYNNDTLAALYAKLGKKSLAIATAKKAITLAESEGMVATETIKMLEDLQK